MYYYILESPSSRSVRQQYQRLRDLLTNLGIAGEMVAASPARTPEELTLMGIQKGYSTIVAVGADLHINRIATAIQDRAVLGIIPIDASGYVVEMVGSDDLRQAAQTLKQRRLTNHNLLVIEPDGLAFLDVELNSPDKLAKVSLVLDNRLRGYSYFNHLRINRNLEIDLESSHMTEPRKVLGLFTVGGNLVKSSSHFHAKVAKLVSEPELPLVVAGKVIGKTPAQLRTLPDALKVISRRGTLE